MSNTVLPLSLVYTTVSLVVLPVFTHYPSCSGYATKHGRLIWKVAVDAGFLRPGRGGTSLCQTLSIRVDRTAGCRARLTTTLSRRSGICLYCPSDHRIWVRTFVLCTWGLHCSSTEASVQLGTYCRVLFKRKVRALLPSTLISFTVAVLYAVQMICFSVVVPIAGGRSGYQLPFAFRGYPSICFLGLSFYRKTFSDIFCNKCVNGHIVFGVFLQLFVETAVIIPAWSRLPLRALI